MTTSEEVLTDDQSHYEISLTGGQAFVGFVLLLLSLAASFAFGLMIGRGQIDEKVTTTRKDSVVITEKAAPAAAARETRVAAPEEDFKEAEIAEEKPHVAPASAGDLRLKPEPHPSGAPVAFYAQLLSTADQKRAEALAVKLIEGGFPTAHVERGSTDKGDIFRVRIRFPSEGEARAAEAKLKTFVPDVWITRETR